MAGIPRAMRFISSSTKAGSGNGATLATDGHEHYGWPLPIEEFHRLNLYSDYSIFLNTDVGDVSGLPFRTMVRSTFIVPSASSQRFSVMGSGAAVVIVVTRT